MFPGLPAEVFIPRKCGDSEWVLVGRVFCWFCFVWAFGAVLDLWVVSVSLGEDVFFWLVGFGEGGVPLRDHDPGSLFCPGRLFSFQANIRVQLSLRSGRI